ncbi:MAG: hypothetical protein A2600_13775 [Candidatus Lambdaproteobacteria bacterium RIFOXYD1_FULL_56_27]|uniref:Uncharacterized protein n=1 Tax=Candidatus Lambdaproteobacteria bacterium RIFOXYD2_FULL_56_26 TaxID=1817773 RepID=A0A1F6GLJ4_9PROT|nr:MAG: hypothetical protein A2557_00585 [Candidatus Lambdaproteobacteria bacterium RIFOXYD2_FULL_56_26]OGH01559.1 MAG: hypothetical protein A2426_11335 [Candidatus Lambdaproteobacteria bacterium RIFOXYC1_FULL_56_13]OGH08823.1 MAG: hypothetical protein A2600_13775 [Candidatus Lambdaproteobacteria bacterium RIFOXYD1_FULL_56_27]
MNPLAVESRIVFSYRLKISDLQKNHLHRTLPLVGERVFQELAEETRALLRGGIPYFVLVESGSPNGFEFTGGVAKVFTAKPVGEG